MIHTSYFAKSGKYPNAVSIARSAPREFKGESIYLLAPTADLLKRYKAGYLLTEYYIEEFNEQLAKLNPIVIGQMLEGKILLCWEHSEKFCHRQIVAKWLRNAGFEVKEL